MAVTPHGTHGTDWFEWHTPYDDPTSPLAQRLRAVQRLTSAALDRCPPGPVRVISVCSGQGRDLLPLLPRHGRREDVRARLVELDPRNTAVARATVREAGLDGVEVVTGDATVTTVYEGMVPANVVLLCGVFGHASEDDIHHVIGRLPELCAAGATVVWTRSGSLPDLRPVIRRWFSEEGFLEVGFESGGDRSWGVGANQLAIRPRPFQRGVRLFTFLDAGTGLPV